MVDIGTSIAGYPGNGTYIANQVILQAVHLYSIYKGHNCVALLHLFQKSFFEIDL